MTAHANASDKVKNAIEHGDSSLCDGFIAAHWYTFDIKQDGRPYRVIHLKAGDRDIEINVSPAGRSVRVFVDRTEVKQ
jgi:hypothetical protein